MKSLSRYSRWDQIGKRAFIVLSLIAGSLASLSPALAQQSTTGPVPPPGTDRGLEVPKRAQVVLNVPAYLWQHGCGPTAAGMVIGYWETQGFDHLVGGDDAWNQTSAVNAMIASDNNNPSCGLSYSDHYQDYSCPIDGGSGSPLPDRSTTGGAHPSSCIADFMRTSWSSAGNFYGWSWFDDVGPSLTQYPTYADPAYEGLFRVDAWFYEEVTFDQYKAEIDAGRPVVLLVDTDGDGGTDHFVTGIGYSESPNRYACHDTWDTGVHWYGWRGLGVGSTWGIYGVHFFGPQMGYSATPTSGEVPLNVQFTGTSFLPAQSWVWSFGDGDSAFVQSPSHLYDSPGAYDVSLEVVAGETSVRFERADYVIAVADTIRGHDLSAADSSTVEMVISGNNTIPLWRIAIPVTYQGSLEVTLDSFSTAGCRTDYFPSQGYISADPANHRSAILLALPYEGPIPDLPPGEGPILKVYFSVGAGAPGQSAEIGLGGYMSYVPTFTGDLLSYSPKVMSSVMTYFSCCEGIRGDGNGDGDVRVSDLTFLVSYLFVGGVDPECLAEVDVDGSGLILVSDLTYLVNYLFRSGPLPASCE